MVTCRAGEDEGHARKVTGRSWQRRGVDDYGSRWHGEEVVQKGRMVGNLGGLQ